MVFLAKKWRIWWVAIVGSMVILLLMSRSGKKLSATINGSNIPYVIYVGIFKVANLEKVSCLIMAVRNDLAKACRELGSILLV